MLTGRRLILNDGTIIEDGEAGYAQRNLWLWFTGYTLQDAASIFFNAFKTAHIIFQYGEMQDEYDGYTNCTALQIDTDGRISICLTKGNTDA